uniref:Cation efflux protein transmembrane domain-containing protein n=1 Tax=Corethron hystrix TaxID=216773 RepID=A0A7S1BA16_9STRA|mmetsp:Transcript_18509/g.42329  ORF Transcript_18509/g.42329 Transcript_18509/m.42329 type:complete len:362 (+) Transcript_18509:92-1177(+)
MTSYEQQRHIPQPVLFKYEQCHVLPSFGDDDYNDKDEEYELRPLSITPKFRSSQQLPASLPPTRPRSSFPEDTTKDPGWRDHGTSSGEDDRPLFAAFVTFSAFSAAQIVVAFRSHSRSLLGDSAAMVVDSATYGLNLLAEHRKSSGFVSDRERQLWAIVPPAVSVIVLLGLTSVIVVGSVGALVVVNSNGEDGDEKSPDLFWMMGFSITNLVLDLVNVGCFCKTASAKRRRGGGNDDKQEGGAHSFFWICAEEMGGNLNLCSAYTHVMADTMRTFAVILACLAALMMPDAIDARTADAVAALVVSIIIIVSVVPLITKIIGYQREEIAAEIEEDRMGSLSSLEFVDDGIDGPSNMIEMQLN